MILVIDLNKEKNSLAKYEYANPLARITGGEVKHYTDKFNPNEYDAIILSGTALKEENLDYNELNWIKDYKKPVLGICAGMEFILQLFGGEQRECKEIGMVKIVTIKENKLFQGEFEAYALHNFIVTIPEDFETLAKSDKCAEAAKHKEKEIYGVQFHPESRNENIIKNFIKLTT